jgi:hypothetical protein
MRAWVRASEKQRGRGDEAAALVVKRSGMKSH